MLGSALFHHQEGPKPMPPASLTLRVLLMSGCADFQQGTWHYGEHQPLHLLRNNGDSWKEGSESITRIAKGCIPYGLEDRPGCLIAGETRRMQRPPERSSGYLLPLPLGSPLLQSGHWGPSRGGRAATLGTSAQVLSHC